MHCLLDLAHPVHVFEECCHSHSDDMYLVRFLSLVKTELILNIILQKLNNASCEYDRLND